jgi:Zn ribbon nucleic-acid-binding protein
VDKSEPFAKPYHDQTLLEFSRRFPTEEACWKYLLKTRWPQGYSCPKCQQRTSWFHESRKLHECRACGFQTSATAGTLFHKSRTPLQKWFWAIYLMATSKKGVSMLYLQKHLGIRSYRTAWTMGHKIRKAMLDREALYKLKGTVQVDEMPVGGYQSLAHRRKFRVHKKTDFLIAVQEGAQSEPRFVTFEELESSFKEHVLPALEKRIVKGSLLKSDEAGVFIQAGKHGYRVKAVPMSTDPETAKKHLHWVFVLSSNLKRGLLSTYHGCFPKYRKAYLAEFAYRFNRRYWPHQAFDRLLFACLNARPVTLPELRA